MKITNSIFIAFFLLIGSPSSEANFITFDMGGKIARDLRAKESAKLLAELAKQQMKEAAAQGKASQVVQWGVSRGADILGLFGVREAAKQVLVRARPAAGAAAAPVIAFLLSVIQKNHDVTPAQIAQWRVPYDEYFDRLWDKYAQDKIWVTTTRQTLVEATAALNVEFQKKFLFPIPLSIDSKNVFLSQTPSSQTYQVTHTGNTCINQTSCEKRYFELNADLFVTPQARDMAIAHLATLSFNLLDSAARRKVMDVLERTNGFQYATLLKKGRSPHHAAADFAKYMSGDAYKRINCEATTSNENLQQSDCVTSFVKQYLSKPQLDNEPVIDPNQLDKYYFSSRSVPDPLAVLPWINRKLEGVDHPNTPSHNAKRTVYGCGVDGVENLFALLTSTCEYVPLKDLLSEEALGKIILARQNSLDMGAMIHNVILNTIGFTVVMYASDRVSLGLFPKISKGLAVEGLRKFGNMVGRFVSSTAVFIGGYGVIGYYMKDQDISMVIPLVKGDKRMLDEGALMAVLGEHAQLASQGNLKPEEFARKLQESVRKYGEDIQVVMGRVSLDEK
jgi:hypothetical protein